MSFGTLRRLRGFYLYFVPGLLLLAIVLGREWAAVSLVSLLAWLIRRWLPARPKGLTAERPPNR